MQRKLAPCPSTPANPSPTAPPTSPPPRAPLAPPSSVKSPMRNFLLAHLTRRVPHPAVFRVRVFHFAKTLKLVILRASDKDVRRTSPFNIFELRSSKNSSLLCALCVSALRSPRFSLLSHPLIFLPLPPRSLPPRLRHRIQPRQSRPSLLLRRPTKRIPPNGSNRGRYRNPKVDELTDANRVDMNQTKRKALTSAVQKLLPKISPTSPFATPT